MQSEPAEYLSMYSGCVYFALLQFKKKLSYTVCALVKGIKVGPMSVKQLRPYSKYSKSKFKLNSKKVELE